MTHLPLDRELRGYRFLGGLPPATPEEGQKPWGAHPPFAAATRYHRNVYWWWWYSLRLVEGYKSTCASAGKRGHYKQLYAEFGNVHSGTFHDWFLEHGASLFAEPRHGRVRAMEPGEAAGRQYGEICVRIPPGASIGYATEFIRKLINKRRQDRKAQKKAALIRASYRPANKTRPKAIYLALAAWSARQANPKITLFAMAKKLGIKPSAGNADDNKSRMESDAARALAMGIGIMEHVARKDRELYDGGSVSEFPIVTRARGATR